MKMKKAALALALAACMLFAACGEKQPEKPAEGGSMGGTQLANPMTEWSTMEEAADKIGFSLEAGEIPEGYEQRAIHTIQDEILQLTFKKDGKELVVRKASGTDEVSGDYNQYTEESEETLSDKTVVKLKSEDGQVKLAVWNRGNKWSYSVSSAGLSKEEMLAFAESID